jgi:hypothetical protein
MEDKKLMTDLLRQHLHRAQQRMKFQADKNRQERTFQVGDSVFLKLQLYVQSSLASRANQKLSFKFFGPFKIPDKVGSVAYKLELPSSASIHPVFHVSQLKKAVPSSSWVSDLLPDLSTAWQVPEQILAKKMVSRGSSSVQQVLVKWSGWPEALATWEDSEALYHRFPAAPLGGKQALYGEGMSAPQTGARRQLGLVVRLGPPFPVCVFLAQIGAGRCSVACVRVAVVEYKLMRGWERNQVL